MSMNVFKTIKGDVIQFKNPNSGQQHDQDLCKKHLIVNNRYMVSDVRLYNWHTEIELYDFPGVVFNSVMFDNVGVFPEDVAFDSAIEEEAK